MHSKNGKWAKQVLSLQHADGTWGLMFHSLAMPTPKYPLTTEQALRRLHALHFDMRDAPIQKTVAYMKACLRSERKLDAYWEKTHDWPLFTQLMLSTWIRVFEPNDALALAFAARWADVVEKAFATGSYRDDAYIAAYTSQFSSKPRGAREVGFVDFYHISLLQNSLRPAYESCLLDYVLSHPNGLYYVYQKPLNRPPEVFASREASRYLAALDVVAGYGLAKDKLGFAVDWLAANRDAGGGWDLGPRANDGVYFPLSDSWKSMEVRRTDCTERITALLRKIGV